MTGTFDAAVANLAVQIANKTADADAEELALLAKAAESIGGKVSALDIHVLSNAKKAEIETLTTSKKGEITDLSAAKKDEIVALTGAKKTEINDLAAQRKTEFDANAAAVTGRTTALEGRATALEGRAAVFQSDLVIRKSYGAAATSLTLAAGEMAATIEVDGPKANDFTTVDFVLPDATMISAFLSREVVLKNRSLARLQVKTSAGTILGIVPPYAFGRLSLVSATSAAGAWRFTALTAPAARDRHFVTGVSGTLYMGADFDGWNQGQGIFGAASYSDNLFAIPHLDDAGQSLRVALLTSVFQTSNSWRGALIAPAPLDGGTPAVASWGYGFSHQSYHWSGNAIQWNAIPVRGGIVTFGCQNANSVFEVNYFRPPYTTRVGLMSEPYGGGASPYYALAMTFDDGRYLVLVLWNSSGQLCSIRRYRFKADGTAEAAGTIALPQSGASVYPVNATTLALTTNGTQLSVFDVAQAGTTWTPTTATAAFPFVAANMANRVALPMGRDVVIASDGAYQFDGAQTFTKIAGGASYVLPATDWSQNFNVLHVQHPMAVVNGPLGPNYGGRLYFFEADGTLASRDLNKVVADGSRWGGTAPRLTPVGGDQVFTSFAMCYTINSSQNAGMKAGLTTLTRVAAGNIGVSGLGGKI